MAHDLHPNHAHPPDLEHGAHEAHSRDHGHADGHVHVHGPTSGRAFVISVTLNGLFVVAELSAGILSHSMALVADAAHNFGDVVGLLLAWGAAYLARRKPSVRRTYGFRRSTILASVANAVLLLVGVGAVSWEAIGRLRAGAHEVQGTVVLTVAALGVVINLGSALPFFRARKTDVNVRAAFTHLMADAAVSVGVVIAGALMIFTHWMWLDALVSLLVSLVILVSTWSLLRDSLNLALDAVPDGIDPDEVRSFLCGLEGVTEVHDLHIWGMSTTHVAVTAHLVKPGVADDDALLAEASRGLHDRFGIEHSTLQVERSEDVANCRQAPAEVV